MVSEPEMRVPLKRCLPALITITAGLAAVDAFPVLLSAQSLASGASIPADAVVIERATIPARVHRERELVLWMISAEKHDRGPVSKATRYTCPERTLGSYFSGPTRISLLDTRTKRVINTLRLMSVVANVDEFYIPYRILNGLYYDVPGVSKEAEGKPRLLALRDLNGDGIAAETAFFEAEACMGLPTTLIGYSPAQDKVIQYRADLQVTEYEFRMEGKIGGGKRLSGPRTETQLWIDYLFSKKPVQPGHWKYEIDYRGRGGCLDSYDVRYDPARERFVGTLTSLCPTALDMLPRKQVTSLSSSLLRWRARACICTRSWGTGRCGRI